MARITLFSGYDQAENRTTNYCLLLLKMIYDENPKLLADVLSSLVGESVSDRVGVEFTQQRRERHSIPDGTILQEAFTLCIETKRADQFDPAQPRAHLHAPAARQGTRVLMALGSFEGHEPPCPC